MRVLVTGASGFIGRHLVARLLADGRRVVAVARTAAAETSAGATLVRADLAEPGWTRALPADIDGVFHLAQSRRYREFPAGAEDMRRINVDATHELADWAARSGVRWLVHASTGNVYGAQARPLREDDPCEPADFYGASKLAAELLLRPYGRLLAVRLLRLFTVFGPEQGPATIPNLIRRLRADEPLTLAGGEGLFLSPLYVDDCVDALMRAGQAAGPAAVTVHNLAGSEVASLRRLGAVLGEALALPVRVEALPGAPGHLAGDATTFGRDFGWAPRVALDDALRRTAIAATGTPAPDRASLSVSS